MYVCLHHVLFLFFALTCGRSCIDTQRLTVHIYMYLNTTTQALPNHLHRSCKSNGMICDGEPHILFAWALNASGLHLPPDVGVQVGPSVRINSVVIQIHYGYPESEYTMCV